MMAEKVPLSLDSGCLLGKDRQPLLVGLSTSKTRPPAAPRSTSAPAAEREFGIQWREWALQRP